MTANPANADMADLVETYGREKAKIFHESRRDPREKKPRLPTGFFNLDSILKGGVRAGSYIELFGPESVGKSYLALRLMAQCQKIWKRPACYLDFENSWDGERAEELGVDLSDDKMKLLNLPNIEENYNFLRGALARNKYGIIIIDSISGMPPTYETENVIEKQTVAYQARVHSKGLRVITPFLGKNILILINQVRDSMSMFGDPVATAGGRAILHYDHQRIRLDKVYWREEMKVYDYDKMEESSDKKKVIVGHDIKVRLVKNKSGAPEQGCRLRFSYERAGVDEVQDVIDYLVAKPQKVITKSGHFFGVPVGDVKTNGKSQLYDHVADNLAEYRLIAQRVMNGTQGDHKQGQGKD